MQYDFDFLFMLEKFPVLLQKGATMTVEMTLITLCLGSFIGAVLAIMRISKVKLLNWIAAVYVWAFRGIPMIVLLFFLYSALPSAGITFSPMVASIFALTLVSSSYMCEIIRGGILSIPKGQFEAAHSLGFTYLQQMIHLIIPQTLRSIVPPTGNEFIGIMKDTAIVSTVAMVETVRVAQQIGATTFRYIEIYIDAALIFLLMTSVFTVVFNRVEKHLAKKF